MAFKWGVAAGINDLASIACATLTESAKKSGVGNECRLEGCLLRFLQTIDSTSRSTRRKPDGRPLTFRERRH